MIKIAERLRPFSHLPGTRCLIPSTSVLVEAYPALILLKNFEGKILKEMTLEIEGPLKQFTVMQDLERGCVTVFSEQFSFHILPNLEIVYTKKPHLSPLPINERLSLGSHKKQEWEAIRKRGDFREIFPLWYRLGSLLDLPPREESDIGIFSLLNACKEAVFSHRPETIIPAFRRLFLAGFRDLFVPRLKDEDFQGILPSNAPLAKSSPLYLLEEGAVLIRSLFLLSSENEHAILPNLPPEFFAGRMLNLACSTFGELDLEWTKKTIRRMVFRAKQEGEIFFHFHPNLRSFRLRQSLKDRGKRVQCGSPLEINSGSLYLLDQFQK